MYHSAKNIHHGRVNFDELLKVAVSDRELVRALAYVVKGGDTEEEQAFFDALEKAGFELKMKDIQVFSSGAKKADWDVGLAVDVIAMSKQLDVVVIISGDGDFVPLVQYLQHLGVIVEVVSFGRSTSLRLKETVNNFIDLDDHKGIILRGRSGGRARQPAQDKPKAQQKTAEPAQAAPGKTSSEKTPTGKATAKRPRRRRKSRNPSSGSGQGPSADSTGSPQANSSRSQNQEGRGTFMTRAKRSN
jgi:uncharacterized LabA/DUF88 family protein